MKKGCLVTIGIILVCIIVITLGGLFYYKDGLKAVDSNSKKTIELEIKEGDTYYTIATDLEKKGLIKSDDIYKIYLKLNKRRRKCLWQRFLEE